MPYLADGVAKQTGWEMAFTVGGLGIGTLRPILILSPILAQTIAKAGWKKKDVRQYLFDHARTEAWRVETMMDKWVDFRIGSLQRQVNLGRSSDAECDQKIDIHQRDQIDHRRYVELGLLAGRPRWNEPADRCITRGSVPPASSGHGLHSLPLEGVQQPHHACTE